MQKLKEALRGVVFTDREEVINQGRRAYRMMIEQRANPRKPEGERKLWDIGWAQERDSFAALLKKNEGSLR